MATTELENPKVFLRVWIDQDWHVDIPNASHYNQTSDALLVLTDHACGGQYSCAIFNRWSYAEWVEQERS